MLPPARVAELAQQAQELLANGSLESSMACVDSAFAIIETDGSEEDVVFTCVLVAAESYTPPMLSDKPSYASAGQLGVGGLLGLRE